MSEDTIDKITEEIREMAAVHSAMGGDMDEGEMHRRLERFAYRLQATGMDGEDIQRILAEKLLPGVFDHQGFSSSSSDHGNDYVIDRSNLPNPHPESSVYYIYGPTIPGVPLQCGDIVTRSKQWQHGSEDGGAGSTGLVYKVSTERAYVTWKSGGTNTSGYYLREVQKVGRARNVHLGDTVVRGPDWKHGDQDGGTRGIVTKFANEGRELYVLWGNQRQANYRWGYAYDVKVVKSLYGIDAQEDSSSAGAGHSVGGGGGGSGGGVRSEYHIGTFHNNPSYVWMAGDFVVRGPFWQQGNMADGGGGMFGVVQGVDAAGTVRVRWPTTGKTESYHPDDLALVLPACTETKVSFKHRMHRTVDTPARATAATFLCKYCRAGLLPLDRTRPPFHCQDCASSMCAACYHKKGPKQAHVAQAGISLIDSRKLFSGNTGSGMFDAQVNFFLELFDGNVQDTVDDYRKNPPDSESRDRIPPLPQPRTKLASPPRALSSGPAASAASPAPAPASASSALTAIAPQRPAAHASSPTSTSNSAPVAFTNTSASMRNDPSPDDYEADGEGPGMHLTALVLGGNLKEMQRLVLEQGVDVNAVGMNGRTCFHTAAGHGGKREIVEWLLTLPQLDVNMGDFSGETALAHAVEEGDMAIIELLLQRPEIEFGGNFNGVTPFHRAALCKNPDVSRAVTACLLSHPAGPAASSAVDSNQMSPLHLAVRADSHAETARLLCDAGSDLFCMNNNNFHPLSEATYKGSAACVKVLLEYRVGHSQTGQPQTDIVDEAGSSALHIAASFDRAAIVHLLADAGADLEQKCNKGLTPLHKAVRRTVSNEQKEGKASVNSALALIDRGANVHALDKDNDTALHVACMGGLSTVVRKLCEMGVLVDAKNHKGMTALHLACAGNGGLENQLATIRVLVEWKADLESLDIDEETPISVACGHSPLPIVALLLELGANPNVRAAYRSRKNGNRTPLMTAALNGKSEVIQLLLQHGASPLDQDSDGDDSIQYAIGGQEEYHDCVRILLTAPDASPFMGNNKGSTALHRAASKGFVTSVGMFLRHATAKLDPGSINLQDEAGDTALMDAARRGQHDAVKMLLEHGADTKICNKQGRDAPGIGKSQSDAKMLQLFKDAPQLAAAFHSRRLAEQQEQLEAQRLDGSDIVLSFRSEGVQNRAFERRLFEFFPSLEALRSAISGLPAKTRDELPEKLIREMRGKGVTLELMEEINVMRGFVKVMARMTSPSPSPAVSPRSEGSGSSGSASGGGSSGGSAARGGFVDAPPRPPFSPQQQQQMNVNDLKRQMSDLTTSTQSDAAALSGSGRPSSVGSLRDSFDLLPPPAAPAGGGASASPAASFSDSTTTGSGSGGGGSKVSSLSSGSETERFTIPWDELHVRDGQTKIGQGSFGIVFKAVWRRKRGGTRQAYEVAVKVVTRSSATSKGIPFDKAVEQARREFETLYRAAQVVTNKDCIVQVLAISEGKVHQAMADALPGIVNANEDAVGIVMRYEGGGSLASLLYPTDPTRPQRPLSSQDRLHILKQIASGVEELHSVGIVHGDLKPENILLSSHNPPLVRIADFGLSKYREEFVASSTAHRMTESMAMTHVSHFAGTKLYAAPEMLPDLQSADPDFVCTATRKTDIYAFALIMWEVLCRKRPYDSLLKMRGPFAEMHLLQAIVRGDKPDIDLLDSLHGEVPVQELKDLITSCWADRAQREPAYMCFKVLDLCHARACGSSFDLFFSYRWTQQKIGLYIVKLLSECGYRVWIDKKNMGHDLVASMTDGVKTATVFLCVVSKDYQTSPNCMFELSQARLLGKPIVVLVADAEPLVWGSQELKDGASLVGKRWIDISSIAADPVWAPAAAALDAAPTPELHQQLKEKIENDILDLLEDHNCHPSLSLEASCLTTTAPTPA